MSLLLVLLPEAGVVAAPEEIEPLWVRQNRYHVNKGHWNEVSVGQVLRWPP